MAETLVFDREATTSTRPSTSSTSTLKRSFDAFGENEMATEEHIRVPVLDGNEGNSIDGGRHSSTPGRSPKRVRSNDAQATPTTSASSSHHSPPLLPADEPHLPLQHPTPNPLHPSHSTPSSPHVQSTTSWESWSASQQSIMDDSASTTISRVRYFSETIEPLRRSPPIPPPTAESASNLTSSPPPESSSRWSSLQADWSALPTPHESDDDDEMRYIPASRIAPVITSSPSTTRRAVATLNAWLSRSTSSSSTRNPQSPDEPDVNRTPPSASRPRLAFASRRLSRQMVPLPPTSARLSATPSPPPPSSSTSASELWLRRMNVAGTSPQDTPSNAEGRRPHRVRVGGETPSGTGHANSISSFSSVYANEDFLGRMVDRITRTSSSESAQGSPSASSSAHVRRPSLLRRSMGSSTSSVAPRPSISSSSSTSAVVSNFSVLPRFSAQEALERSMSIRNSVRPIERHDSLELPPDEDGDTTMSEYGALVIEPEHTPPVEELAPSTPAVYRQLVLPQRALSLLPPTHRLAGPWGSRPPANLSPDSASSSRPSSSFRPFRRHPIPRFPDTHDRTSYPRYTASPTHAEFSAEIHAESSWTVNQERGLGEDVGEESSASGQLGPRQLLLLQDRPSTVTAYVDTTPATTRFDPMSPSLVDLEEPSTTFPHASFNRTSLLSMESSTTGASQSTHQQSTSSFSINQPHELPRPNHSLFHGADYGEDLPNMYAPAGPIATQSVEFRPPADEQSTSDITPPQAPFARSALFGGASSSTGSSSARRSWSPDPMLSTSPLSQPSWMGTRRAAEQSSPEYEHPHRVSFAYEDEEMEDHERYPEWRSSTSSESRLLRHRDSLSLTSARSSALWNAPGTSPSHSSPLRESSSISVRNRPNLRNLDLGAPSPAATRAHLLSSQRSPRLWHDPDANEPSSATRVYRIVPSPLTTSSLLPPTSSGNNSDISRGPPSARSRLTSHSALAEYLLLHHPDSPQLSNVRRTEAQSPGSTHLSDLPPARPTSSTPRSLWQDQGSLLDLLDARRPVDLTEDPDSSNLIGRRSPTLSPLTFSPRSPPTQPPQAPQLRRQLSLMSSLRDRTFSPFLHGRAGNSETASPSMPSYGLGLSPALPPLPSPAMDGFASMDNTPTHSWTPHHHDIPELSPLTPSHPLPGAPRAVPRTLSGADGPVWTGFTPQSSRNNSLNVTGVVNRSVLLGLDSPMMAANLLDNAPAPGGAFSRRVSTNGTAASRGRHGTGRSSPPLGDQWRGWTLDAELNRTSLGVHDGPPAPLPSRSNSGPNMRHASSGESVMNPYSTWSREEDVNHWVLNHQGREERRRSVLSEATRSAHLWLSEFDDAAMDWPPSAERALRMDDERSIQSQFERERFRPRRGRREVDPPQTGSTSNTFVPPSQIIPQHESARERVNRLMNIRGESSANANQEHGRTSRRLSTSTLAPALRANPPEPVRGRASTPPRSSSVPRRRSPPASPFWGETAIGSVVRDVEAGRTHSPTGGRTSTSRMRRLLRRHVEHTELLSDTMRDYTEMYPSFGAEGRFGWGSRRPNSFRSSDYLSDGDFDSSYEGLLRLAARIGDAKPPGLPAHLVAALPSLMYKESTEAQKEERCPICLDDYEPTDIVLGVAECGHYFHKVCFEQWLGTSRTCPVCRRVIQPKRSHGNDGPPNPEDREDNEDSDRNRERDGDGDGDRGRAARGSRMFDLPGLQWGRRG